MQLVERDVLVDPVRERLVARPVADRGDPERRGAAAVRAERPVAGLGAERVERGAAGDRRVGAREPGGREVRRLDRRARVGVEAVDADRRPARSPRAARPLPRPRRAAARARPPRARRAACGDRTCTVHRSGSTDSAGYGRLIMSVGTRIAGAERRVRGQLDRARGAQHVGHRLDGVDAEVGPRRVRRACRRPRRSARRGRAGRPPPAAATARRSPPRRAARGAATATVANPSIISSAIDAADDHAGRRAAAPPPRRGRAPPADPSCPVAPRPYRRPSRSSPAGSADHAAGSRDADGVHVRVEQHARPGPGVERADDVAERVDLDGIAEPLELGAHERRDGALLRPDGLGVRTRSRAKASRALRCESS